MSETKPNGAIQIQQPHLDDSTMLLLVAGGDTSRLTPNQKLAYYKARCDAAGLDPCTQPFEFIRFQGKEILYARKQASDGLAAKHGIKTTIVDQRTEDGIRIVTVRAETRDGRATEDVGALPIAGAKGNDLANALMKAVTKAKRRATLSVCGLGMLDETEIETIPGATYVAPPQPEDVPPVEAEVAQAPAPEETDPVLASFQAATTLKALTQAMGKVEASRKQSYSAAYNDRAKALREAR